MTNLIHSGVPLVEPIEEERVVIPEVLGAPQKPSGISRIWSRFLLAFILACLGLALSVLGIVLIVTIIGAVVGLPLLFLGALSIVAAVLIAFGGGRLVVWRGSLGPWRDNN